MELQSVDGLACTLTKYAHAPTQPEIAEHFGRGPSWAGKYVRSLQTKKVLKLKRVNFHVLE